jgi:archaellum biogenesis ATPase FlaH
MKTLKLEYHNLWKLLPGGLPIPSSTLISGKGGTGKPLVELAFVASWLKNGGSAIGIPLQYPTTEFVKNAMLNLYGIDLWNAKGKIAYLQFDPTSCYTKRIGDQVLKTNLLIPELWDESIEAASNLIENKTELLVFGSALNLLLFSPTYKDRMLNKIREILETDKTRSYIFSVSNNVLGDQIATWEQAADNLIFTRMEEPMRLFLKIYRMKNAPFSTEEVKVPISQGMLKEMKAVAGATRKRTIPVIMNI